MVQTTIEPVPLLRTAIDDLSDRRRMSAGIKVMATRRGDFRDELEMQLTGISMIPDAREFVNDAMNASWEGNSRPVLSPSTEVVIGGGFAAAVYCANRVASGFPRPVVLDMNDAAHVGGTFALSGITPAWYLNSENRGGLPGFPADLDALNTLPGAPLQASMVTSGEYPTNADMAWVIRLSLAQNAIVYPYAKVLEYDGDNDIRVEYRGERMPLQRAGRIVDVTGIGQPRDAGAANGESILTFDQFMARQADDFPLRDYRRVAVIGGGDGGKVSAESVLGIGPASGMSVKGLDQVERLDMYAEELPDTTEGWREFAINSPSTRVRTRYMRLGSYLPSRNDRQLRHDLTVYQERAQFAPVNGGALVNGRTYDHVIVCTGYRRPDLGGGFQDDYVTLGGTRVARRSGYAQYRAGVAANLPFQNFEEGYSDIAANKVAMFRHGPRIAALAQRLPEVGSDPFSF